MKKHFYLTFVPLIFLLGCEHSVETQYIIENNTQHTITIDFFSRKLDPQTHSQVVSSTRERTIKIDADSSWEEIYKEPMATNSQVNFLFKSDSAVVFYDQAKYQIYSIGDTSVRNILWDESYVELESNRKNNLHYFVRKYTFTEDDYENAKPILD